MNPERGSVLVPGATGDIGGPLVPRLLECGLGVRGQARDQTTMRGEDALTGNRGCWDWLRAGSRWVTVAATMANVPTAGCRSRDSFGQASW